MNMHKYKMLAIFVFIFLNSCSAPNKYVIPPEEIKYPSVERFDIDGIPFHFRFALSKYYNTIRIDPELTVSSNYVKSEEDRIKLKNILSGINNLNDMTDSLSFSTKYFDDNSSYSYNYSGDFSYSGLLITLSKSYSFYNTPRGIAGKKISINEFIYDICQKYGAYDVKRTETQQSKKGKTVVYTMWWGVSESEIRCNTYGVGTGVSTICTTGALSLKRKSFHVTIVDTSELKDFPYQFTSTITMDDDYSKWRNFMNRHIN